MTLHITCTRLLAFDAAHRVAEHESKCKYVHGHRYTVEASFAAPRLDALGRVADFGVIKERLGGWLDQHWDHTAILWEKDAPLGEAIAALTRQRIFYLPYNPTAENLARYLLEEICPSLFAQSNLRCMSVRVWETPNCFADAVHDE
ncbi:MAG: 6-carboxytetrahydropterin synthase [Alphaproteobacteria bacterium]|nr:6-carboxytetrahydropterin synthase [Alphaproteobacteria bacterium]